ncbi:MAG: hypothetical protein ACPGVU_05980 [Limisphaerales bacterium]
MKTLSRIFAVFTLAGVVASTMAGPVIKQAITGSPNLKVINVISFAPGGVLLIGDGRSQQIVAVDTGDTDRAKGKWGELNGFAGKLGARLGAQAKGVEIIDMAVNPDSRVLYVAARK